jgi:DNA polymerase I
LILRVPTQYSQHRAESGRLSSGFDSSDPTKGKRKKVMQMQNIPRRARDSFVAEPGCILVGADYKAIEWGSMMYFGTQLPGSSGFHQGLIDKFVAGDLDPHRFLASVMLGLPEASISRKQRDEVKPYTYGYWKTAWSVGLRVGHTQAVANVIGMAHERAFRMNPIRTWMEGYVKRTHYAETALGFRRYFWDWKPKAEEIYAHFGQGTAADLMKDTLVRVFAVLPTLWEVLTNTHDNIVMQVPEKDKEEGAQFLREHMSRPREWMGNIPWPVDVKFGRTWQEVS